MSGYLRALLWMSLSRAERDAAGRRAEMARRVAWPGEPHAKARERVRKIEDDFNRRLEQALLYGGDVR